MLTILVLICSMNVDRSACDMKTATSVVRAMKVETPQQCGFMGQVMLDPTPLIPDPSKQYMKIVCQHQ